MSHSQYSVRFIPYSEASYDVQQFYGVFWLALQVVVGLLLELQVSPVVF